MLIAILSVIAPLVAGNKTQTPTSMSGFGNTVVTDADRRKAEYIYLEAERYNQEGNYPAYFELLRHAYDIDSTNTVAAHYIGMLMLTSKGLTAEDRKVALSLMRKHFLESPADYEESSRYGLLAAGFGDYSDALEVWQTLSKLYPDKPDVQFSLAEAYGATGDFKHALEAYDSLEKSQGKLISLTTRKAQVYINMHDSVSALRECRSLYATAPYNVQYNLLMSRLFATFSMNDSALAYIDNAQKCDPENGAIFLARAQFYNSIGDTVNYDKQIYNALISKNLEVEDKLDVLLEYSRDLVQSNDSSERASTLFRALIEEHPHEQKIHELYSQYLWTIKDFKNSAEQLSYALDVDPTSPDNWRLLMACYLMLENYGEAVKAGESAIKYNPDDVNLLTYLAQAYSHIKNFDRAKELYEAALEGAENTDSVSVPDILGGLGDMYLLQADTVKAIEKYKEALEIDPENVYLLNNYAYMLVERGEDLDLAEEMSRRTVEDSPENTSYLDTYAWILFKKKDYARALEYIEKAVQLDGNEVSGVELEHYGDILFMNGEPDKALKQWERALKLGADSEMLKKKVKYKTYFYK